MTFQYNFRDWTYERNEERHDIDWLHTVRTDDPTSDDGAINRSGGQKDEYGRKRHRDEVEVYVHPTWSTSCTRCYFMRHELLDYVVREKLRDGNAEREDHCDI